MRTFLGWWYLLGVFVSLAGMVIMYSEYQRGTFRTLSMSALLGASLWLFSRAVGIYARDAYVVFMWRNIAYAVNILSPAVMGGMALTAAGGILKLPKKYTIPILALWGGGALVFSYGLIAGKLIEGVARHSYGLDDVYGPWHPAFGVWMLTSVAVVVLLLCLTARELPKGSPFHRGTVILALAILIPMLCSSISYLVLPAMGIRMFPLASVALVFSLILVFTGVWMLKPPTVPYSLAASALSHLPDMLMLLVGLDGRIIWASHRHPHIFPQTPDLTELTLDKLPEALGVKAPSKWQNLWKDPSAYTTTELLDVNRGRAFSMHVMPMEEKQWKPYARLVVIREITAYKKMISAFAKRSRVLQDLAEISRELHDASEGLDELLSLILRRAREIFHADSSVIYLTDEDGTVLREVLRQGGTPRHVDQPVLLDREHLRGFLGRVALERKPMMLEDYQQWPEHLDEPDTKEIRSIMGVPLLYRGNFLGALNLCARTPGVFSYEDLELLEIFSDQAAAAIRNVRLYQEMQRSKVETKQIVENASDAILLLGRDFRVVMANRESEILLGRPREEIIGKVFCDFLSNESCAEARKAWRQVVSHESVRWLPLTVIRGDGSSVPAELNASMQESENIIVVLRDISGRLEAEESVRKREQELRTLHEIALEISAPRPLEELVPIIVRKGVEMLGGAGGGLYLLDEENRLLRLQYVLDPLNRELGQRDLPLDEGLAGMVATTGEVLFVNNYDKWEKRSEKWKDIYFSSLIAAPLIWKGKVIGVQTVAGDVAERTFDRRDAHLISLFAQYVATVIVRQQMFEEMEADRRKLDLLYRISRLLSGSLDVDEVLSTALEQIMTVLHADAGAVWMAQKGKDGGEVLVPTLVRGVPEKWYESLRFLPGEGALGSVFLNKRLLYVENATESGYWQRKGFPAVVGDAVTFPLLSQGESRGVLEVFNLEGRNRFRKEDMELFQAIQDLLEASFTNAYLYQQTQRLLEKLEDEVALRTQEVRKKQSELERLSYLMMGREARMMELKLEIRRLRFQQKDSKTNSGEVVGSRASSKPLSLSANPDGES